MIDTHTHIFLPEFEADLESVIQRATEEGIQAMLLPNVDQQTFEPMMAVCKRYPQLCFPMIGIHPTSIKGDSASQIAFVEKQLSQYMFVAIGEIGIDLYWDKTHLTEQRKAFQAQLHIANIAKLPVCVHIREAFDETFEALLSSGLSNFTGVFHCFSGTAEQAKQAIDMGFVLGIGGPLTYKKSTLPQAIASIPLSAIVLETDAPYLAPHPHRGKRNEPALLREVVRALAQLYQTTEEEVISTTTNTARRVFHLA